MSFNLSRRGIIAGAAALAPTMAFAQGKAQLAPLNTVLNGRTYGPGAPPVAYPDPDVLLLSPEANKLFIGHSNIQRVGTGYLWAEGPAWSNQGQYVVWSDVTGDRQYRYIWETGQVTEFHRPSYNSNGNTFDFQGRQLSCQHFLRRVVRFEHDGTLTVVADSYNGQPLNSPNDIAVHKDGSIWFTDPYYGGQLSEGHPDETPGPFTDGVPNGNIGNGMLGIVGSRKQVRPASVYRVDPSGRIDAVLEGGPDLVPNGIAFSPDYSKVYLCWGRNLSVADVQGGKIANLRTFTDCVVDGIKCGPDGHRVDTYGNVWSGSTAPIGYAGVTVWSPAGKLLARIRTPESIANVCFAGPKRDWLFMCGSQSVYLLRIGAQGAAIG